jgi:uncharacterized protein
MPHRPTRRVPTVIVPGWQGSGPGHWQVLLAEALRADGRQVHQPPLPDADTPSLPAWLATLRATLASLPDAGFDVVCHSLGGVLWLHHAAHPSATPSPARVALVSPPSPDRSLAPAEFQAFLPPPMDVDAIRKAAGGTVLVASDDDPYCPEGAAIAYGRALKLPVTVIPGAGHLNVESGYGPWPAMLSWCGRDNLAFY